jgi:hypothetical protein
MKFLRKPKEIALLRTKNQACFEAIYGSNRSFAPILTFPVLQGVRSAPGRIILQSGKMVQNGCHLNVFNCRNVSEKLGTH